MNTVNHRQGEKHYRAVLTEDKVREIRRLHDEVGMCTKCICLLHGINRGTCWDALSYVTWKHVL